MIAPFLFMFFFGLIQITYTAFAAFAVQRAAFAVAREAASSNEPTKYNPYFQLAYCLAPIGQLSPTTMATVLATRCDINIDDEGYVHAQVSYPMPIWVPLIGKIFGRPFQISSALRSPMEDTLERVFESLGKPKPDLSFKQLHFPNVQTLTFTAEALNENSVGYEEE